MPPGGIENVEIVRKTCKIPLCEGDCNNNHHSKQRYLGGVGVRVSYEEDKKTNCMEISLLFFFLQIFENG